ncbi:MAG TPA: hypothetical protein VMT76_17330 [Puia sp.]|nr:hypothetical protein [Puia sp.]
MRTSQAVKILEKHKKVIENPNYDSDFLWQQESLSYIEKFLGKDTNEYRMMNSFHFPTIEERDYDAKLQAIRHLLITSITQAISVLRNVGIKREYHNILCRYSDKELIAGAISVAVVIFSAGFGLAKFLTVCPNI